MFEDIVRAEVNVPNAASRVYKDECMLSFDTPESPEGLYVDLASFEAFSHHFVENNHRLTGHRVYLNIKRRKVARAKKAIDETKEKPTVLGIGVEGGFEKDGGWEWVETYEIVLLPDFGRVPFPSDEVPSFIAASAAGVIQASSASLQDDVVAFSVDEKVEESKFSKDLLQLDPAGKKIPPKNWVCDVEGCGIKENLWMNLTDGFIGCSRKLWDGSGGNGHALQHFEETQFPLSVKLGTIGTDVKKIDIMSYTEGSDGKGGLVTDANIVHHLAHWGIDISAMQASEKGTKELELSLNEKLDLHVLEKHGEPLFGPGLTGINNLGNSCYMNSVLQVLFATEPFSRRYLAARDAILRAAPVRGAGDVLTVQLSKVADGLLSGNYSIPATAFDEDEQAATAAAAAAGESASGNDATAACEAAVSEEKKQEEKKGGKIIGQKGITPRMFKHLMGRDHPEFSSARQQDAMEYYQHVLQRIERADKAEQLASDASVVRDFTFDVEERVQCSQSGQVRLKLRPDNLITLPVPLEQASNAAEVEACKKRIEAGETIKQEDIVRPRVAFEKCLEAFAASEQVDDFYSSAIKAKTIALKSTRIATFPTILTCVMRKFYVDSAWVPQKLDVLIDVPEEIDLEWLRAKGLQPGEVELKDEEGDAGGSAAGAGFDASIVEGLVAMGFPEVDSRKAAVQTKNAGVEQALNFMMENDMSQFADPLAPAASSSSSSGDVDEMALVQLISMGINEKHARKALKATDNNVERATEWVFSHDETDDDPMDTSSGAASAAPTRVDGPAKYRLFGCISHIGKSAHSGHYLCHIRKNGQWVLFNDSVVAHSDPVPKELAYLYFFERI